MYNKLIKLINDYDTIVIYRHSRPDGDALGSQFGLREVLRDNFPKKKIYAVGDMTSRYSFMGEVDEGFTLGFNYLGIVLDCSETSLISDDSYQKARKLVKIDHHIYREKFGDLEFVDESYESCAGYLAHLITKMHLKINEKAAKSLFTGIVTDSGRFRYDSTTVNTFEIAAMLLSKGFDMQDIYNNLYVEELDNVLLRAKFTLKMQFTEHHVAYIYTTKEECASEKADIFTISRSIVNTMSGIKGIDVWANFTEDINSDNVFCEIRSNKYNINPIATKFGGGGHAKASGVTLANKEEAMQLLKELDALIEE